VKKRQWEKIMEQFIPLLEMLFKGGCYISYLKRRFPFEFLKNAVSQGLISARFESDIDEELWCEITSKGILELNLFNKNKRNAKTSGV
jgi:hypothetical protein